ncbi:CBO0543 family protein [Niallia sp.]|uniref:CBO0543 family protein n=1 Tax=Niallia sp. TaxID=2837523 RepID=UPI00289A497E|nr:CBO0543 family protein [Niallia sp.]
MGIGLLPVIFRKKPVKEWFLVFFFKGYLSSFVDSVVTSEKWLNFPVRFLPKHFQINVLFDYLLFPITCVVYNQISHHSKLPGIILKSFYLSIPMTIVEALLEKYTKLISYRKGWYWYYTLLTETCTFLLSRTSIALVRKLDKKYENQSNH